MASCSRGLGRLCSGPRRSLCSGCGSRRECGSSPGRRRRWCMLTDLGTALLRSGRDCCRRRAASGPRTCMSWQAFFPTTRSETGVRCRLSPRWSTPEELLDCWRTGTSARCLWTLLGMSKRSCCPRSVSAESSSSQPRRREEEDSSRVLTRLRRNEVCWCGCRMPPSWGCEPRLCASRSAGPWEHRVSGAPPTRRSWANLPRRGECAMRGPHPLRPRRVVPRCAQGVEQE
mmetsp:Transcript_62563/g.179454  ORF Transcript_62563/g.179454 Transcript_62563/m.179454 type:complete len:230 (+) Transcript_62563:918-1607(+)